MIKLYLMLQLSFKAMVSTNMKGKKRNHFKLNAQSMLYKKTSLLCRLQAQTLPSATPTIGKLPHPAKLLKLLNQ